MQNERPIKELLQIMLDNLEMCFIYGCKGLCPSCGKLWMLDFISNHEYCILKDFISKNRPDKENLFSWPPCEIEPRREWLKQQIELLT